MSPFQLPLWHKQVGKSLMYDVYNSNGAFVRDPFVKLFDLRMMKSLPPIPFNAGPDTLRLHPKTPSRLYSCSHTGQLQIYDMSKRQYEYFEQVSICMLVNYLIVDSLIPGES